MKFLYSILFCFLLLTGCNKSNITSSVPLPPTTIISASEAEAAMYSAGISGANFQIPDAKYVLPTKAWIKNEFSDGLLKFQTEFGIAFWSPESNDCDKFALATSFYAKWLNHSSPNRNVNAALTCGELYYVIDNNKGGGAHAINVFIVKDENKLIVLFYEPQERKIVNLSPTEIKSIAFWKL